LGRDRPYLARWIFWRNPVESGLDRPGSRRGGGGEERGGDACIALVGGTLPLARAMQASPPRSSPLPPLRGWMRLKTLNTGIHKNYPCKTGPTPALQDKVAKRKKGLET